MNKRKEIQKNTSIGKNRVDEDICHIFQPVIPRADDIIVWKMGGK